MTMPGFTGQNEDSRGRKAQAAYHGGPGSGTTLKRATTSPAGVRTTTGPRRKRSKALLGCLWCQWTTFRPENVPIAAPVMTSLAQCLLSNIRDHATVAAPPYMMGPMNHALFGHHIFVSDVTAAAAANAAIE